MEKFFIEHGALILQAISGLLGVSLGSYITWVLTRARPNLIFIDGWLESTAGVLSATAALRNMGGSPAYIEKVVFLGKPNKADIIILPYDKGNAATSINSKESPREATIEVFVHGVRKPFIFNITRTKYFTYKNMPSSSEE